MEAETIHKPGPWNTAIKWGVIGGLVSVLISYLGSLNVDWTDMQAVEDSRKGMMQYLGYAILLVCIIMAQIEHRRKDLGGFASYGRMVGVAAIASLAYGVLMGVYMYIFAGFLHPDFQQMILESTAQQMPENVSPEQEEQTLKIMRMTTTPGAFAFWMIIGSGFVGLIMGLISSIFIQKNAE